MDALELTFPAVVAPLKLMGPDGSVRTEVTIEEVELCEADRGSAPSSFSFQHFSSYGSLKAGTSSINDLGSVPLDKIPDGAVSRDGEDASEDFESRNKGSQLSTSSPGVHPRKSLKVPRSSSSSLCSKRPRVVQLEDSLFLSGADDAKDASDKLGSYLKKCNSHEKTQLLKQKSSLSSKRGDKRNLKVSLKTKLESLSTNAGNCSAAPGSSFSGLYGLKSDVHDFTKLTDDPPLSGLLDGSYDCANLSKDKGRKDANVNECFLQSIRKACSVLQLPLPVHPQNVPESESCSNSKPSTSLVTPVSSMEEQANFDAKGTSASWVTDSPSLNKVQDACSNSEPLANVLDFELHKPDDIFVKLGLPLPKDLESLLQDASKSSIPSKNATDLRSAKQQFRRAMLQPFPWSHSFNGHSKANSDSSKLSANRTTCPGRWWRVGNFSNIPCAATDCFTKDLESLTFNQSLFPSTMRVVGSKDGGSFVSVNHHQCGWDSLSSATCSKTSSVLVESRGKINQEANEQQCPRVMAAAQTLCDIATSASLRQNIDGIVRWPKKPSQKSMKARKLKSEETEELYTTPTTYGLWSNNSFKNEGHQTPHPLKKPKLGTTTENRRDNIAQTNCRRPLNWSTPRSSRSSPSKFIEDSVSDIKHSTVGTVKQSSMMPPPATTLLCKAGDGQQKTRKLMLMDWKRGGGTG
ncbi:hypothetical protein IC582_016967 [Cucumis melo]|uniref:Uncharacterized protein n=2 Tax=Cucumis melo TaxID=3656 RepID=A0A5A7TNS5_CUCMM|nr:uncharacterized protein LOC103493138 [Cucumis melo]KAA0044850.1 uncharacterized protein E6C27_scaffold74G001420 [Cucumis melo var. makuwa]